MNELKDFFSCFGGFFSRHFGRRALFFFFFCTPTYKHNPLNKTGVSHSKKHWRSTTTRKRKRKQEKKTQKEKMYLCLPLKILRLLGCCFLFWGREGHNFFSNVPLNQCTQRPMVPMCNEYDSCHLCKNVFWRLYKFETIVRLRLFEEIEGNFKEEGN